MKILVLSFYYRPDLSAGSFRTSSLVDQLHALAPKGSQIDVITTLPNRYHSFAAAAAELESQEGLSVVRLPLPKHQSGMLDQARAFVSFGRGALKQTHKKRYDLVFATSSRLMTLVLATRIARRTRARLYLDVRDIFVDTIKEVLPRRISWLTKPIFTALERYAVSRADKVNLVSAGFADYFKARYPQQQFTFYTNGVDEEFLNPAPAEPGQTLVEGRRVTVLYAGNLGEGQGLHTVLPGLAKAMASRVQFRIIGDGARKRALGLALDAAGTSNVELLPPMDRGRLLAEYRAADILFLHLNDYEAFKRVLPSKLFEYAAVGKPLWAGVAGYAADFVRSEVSNAAVFRPCDVEGAVRSFDELSLHSTPRTDFIEKYGRARITQQMARDIIAVATKD